MTTEALVKTVLNYPLLIDIYAYNSIGEGLSAVSNYFPGINELLECEDTLKCLNEYRKKVIDNGNLSLIYADSLIDF